MGLNFRISVLHIIVGFVTTFFMYMIYDSYVVSEEKEIEHHLNRVLKFNKIYLEEAVLDLKKRAHSKKEFSKKLHLEIHNKLKQNPSYDLNKIKKEIVKKYQLEKYNEDIEISLIDENLNIKNSTYENILNFPLSIQSKNRIKELKRKDDFIYLEQFYANIIDCKVKNFAYSKLNEKLFLGFNFISRDLKKEKEILSDIQEVLDVNLDFFYVMNADGQNQFYESIVKNKKHLSFTKKYLESKELYHIRKKTDDYVINSVRRWTRLDEKKGDILNVYIPIKKKQSSELLIPGDVVLKISLDISEQNLFFKTIINKLIFFILLHFLLVFIIFYFTNSYQKIEKELKAQIERNKKLVEYNKQFISNLVHQIRTPLAVIMTNISLLEVLMTKNIEKYTCQINASINMLSNSYENLSYFISFNSLKYPIREIELASFIKERIVFFDQIAYASNKTILSNIEDGFYYEINDIELERVIDNNISNALYFCDEEAKVVISFHKIDDKKVLSFKTSSSKLTNIKDLNKIEENYFKNMSGLGLGLDLIRKIAKKNAIDYKFIKNKEEVVFEYVLK